MPGVTAGVGVTAYAGIPVTHRGASSAVAFVTGHNDPESDDRLDWRALAGFPGTLVVYMGVTRLAALCRVLIRHGKPASTPAAMVQWGTLPRQRTVAATLGDLPERVEKAGLGAPALLVVGEVVSRRPELAWFEDRPLFGRRIVVTRPEGESDASAAILESLGAEALVAPTVVIRPIDDPAPLDRAIARLDEFDWLVFTSSNGVAHFLDRLESQGRDLRALGRVKIAAIGPATAETLSRYRLRADLVPPSFRSEALAEALVREASGKRILLARADRGRAILRDELERVAQVEQIAVYRNADAASLPPEVARRVEEGSVDWITLTSSAIAARLHAMLGETWPARGSAGRSDSPSISPVTSETARRLGWEVAAEAEEFTWEGLVAAIVRAEAAKPAWKPVASVFRRAASAEKLERPSARPRLKVGARTNSFQELPRVRGLPVVRSDDRDQGRQARPVPGPLPRVRAAVSAGGRRRADAGPDRPADRTGGAAPRRRLGRRPTDRRPRRRGDGGAGGVGLARPDPPKVDRRRRPDPPGTGADVARDRREVGKSSSAATSSVRTMPAGLEGRGPTRSLAEPGPTDLAHVSAEVVHPNLVRRFDFGEDRGRTRYSDRGGPSKARHSPHRPPATIGPAAARPLAPVLHAARGPPGRAQSRAYAHGDPSAEHIWIDEGGVVRLAGLGLASMPGADTRDGAEPFALSAARDVQILGHTLDTLTHSRAADADTGSLRLREVVGRMRAAGTADGFKDLAQAIRAMESALGGSASAATDPGDVEARRLADAVARYHDVPLASLRAKLVLGFFGTCLAFAILFGMSGRFALAGGVVGLCGITAAIYGLIRAGLARRPGLFGRVRELVLGGRRADWLTVAAVAAGTIGVLYLLGWLAGWIALGVVAAMLAVGFVAAIDAPIERDREGPLIEARDLLAAMRARGASELAIREFARETQARPVEPDRALQKPSSASTRPAVPGPRGAMPIPDDSASATGDTPCSTGSTPGSATAARPGPGSSRSRSRRWSPKKSTR